MGLTTDPRAKWIHLWIMGDTASMDSLAHFLCHLASFSPSCLCLASSLQHHKAALHKNVQQAQFIYDPHLIVNKLVCLLCATYHKHIFHCLSPLPLSWHYYITTNPITSVFIHRHNLCSGCIACLRWSQILLIACRVSCHWLLLEDVVTFQSKAAEKQICTTFCEWMSLKMVTGN